MIFITFRPTKARMRDSAYLLIPLPEYNRQFLHLLEFIIWIWEEQDTVQSIAYAGIFLSFPLDMVQKPSIDIWRKKYRRNRSKQNRWEPKFVSETTSINHQKVQRQNCSCLNFCLKAWGGKCVWRNNRDNVIDVQWRETCKDGREKNLSRWKVSKVLFCQEQWIKADLQRELLPVQEEFLYSLNSGAQTWCYYICTPTLPPESLHFSVTPSQKGQRKEGKNGKKNETPILCNIDIRRHGSKCEFHHFVFLTCRSNVKEKVSFLWPSDLCLMSSRKEFTLTVTNILDLTCLWPIEFFRTPTSREGCEFL